MCAVVLLALGGRAAVAQEMSGYAGIAFGEFDYDNEVGGPFSDSVSAWKLYGAFQIGSYFSIEFARAWPDTIEVDGPGSPLTIATRRLDVAHRADFTVTTVKFMGRLPLRRFDLWAGVGSHSTDADADFSFTLNGNTRRSSLNVEDTGDVFAAGVDWKLGSADHPFDVRLEYETVKFAFSEAATIALGVATRFGVD